MWKMHPCGFFFLFDLKKMMISWSKRNVNINSKNVKQSIECLCPLHPQSMCWNSNTWNNSVRKSGLSEVIGLWEQSSHEGDSALIKEALEKPFVHFCHLRLQWNRWMSGKQVLIWCQTWQYFDLRLSGL